MIILLLSLLCLFVACAPTFQQNTEMQEDERLFKSKCIGCHSLPDIKSKSDEQWLKIMVDHKNKFSISQKSFDALVKYLQNND